MKIPQEILGENKIRDAAIIKLYVEGKSCSEIKELRKLNLTVRRIEQIVYKNRAFVKIDKDFEEVKQINRIKAHINKAGSSKRDAYDWETLLSDKVSAKKVEHSGKIEGSETNIVIIRSEEKIGDKTFTISRAKESEMNGN